MGAYEEVAGSARVMELGQEGRVVSKAVLACVAAAAFREGAVRLASFRTTTRLPHALLPAVHGFEFLLKQARVHGHQP